VPRNSNCALVIPLLLPITLLLLTTVSSCGGAAGIEAGAATAAAGGAVMNKVGTELINEARAAGASLIAQGQSAGNALLINAGNELNVAADNAVRAVGAELSRQVKDMAAQAQPVLARLQQMIDDTNKLETKTYRFKDASVLDVRGLLRDVPGVGEDFYVQRVDGVAQLKKEAAAYEVAIVGTGLGIATSRIESTTKLLIDN
jgi:hypothetical protein